MRIALCFYGLIGSKIGKNGVGEDLDPAIAYNYYKKHILDKNDNVDIFIHSWSLSAKDRLIELYKPQKECIEKQIDFPTAIKSPRQFGNLKTRIKFYFFRFFNRKKYNDYLKDKNKETFRAYSRWYSSQKALELKSAYEKENNFKYDVVMITRFDVGFFKDIIFDKYDMNYFYASHRNDAPSKENNFTANHENHFKETQFQDLWFFSNSENMDKFALLYDEIENYDISPHVSSKQHVDKFIGRNKIKHTLYRWFDHEMIRRKFFEAQE